MKYKSSSPWLKSRKWWTERRYKQITWEACPLEDKHDPRDVVFYTLYTPLVDVTVMQEDGTFQVHAGTPDGSWGYYEIPKTFKTLKVAKAAGEKLLKDIIKTFEIK